MRRLAAPAHRVAAQTPGTHRVEALIANLGAGFTERSSRTSIRLVREDDEGTARILVSWSHTMPDADGTTADARRQLRRSVDEIGPLLITHTLAADAVPWTLIDETVAWLAQATAADAARSRADAAHRRALAAHQRLDEAQERTARVRDLERHRLARSTTDGVVDELDRVRGVIASGRAVSWPAVHTAMDALIDDLRFAVRGIFPAMLPDRGAADTLRELVAFLPATVLITGDLGRRTGWEIESGFYHAVAAALTAVGSDAAATPVRVHLSRAEALVASIDADGDAALRATLEPDRERLDVLGGRLEVANPTASTVHITVRLSVRSDSPQRAMSEKQTRRHPVHARLTELLARHDLPDSVVHAVTDDLHGSVRILMIDSPMPAGSPGVEIVSAQGAADREMARHLSDEHGPWGRIDAVFTGLPPQAGFREALQSGPVVFRRGISPSQAVEVAGSRAPVVAARRAHSALDAFARATPGHDDLARDLEAIRVSTEDFAEQRLLEEFARGTAPSIISAAALRLLGATGASARARLGLARSDTAADVRAAAAVAAQFWADSATAPGLERNARAAAQTLARCAAELVHYTSVR